MRSTLLVLTLALLAPAGAYADTIIPGGNLGTQSWTTAGSPYVIQGDATVQAGATLTIAAGVTVQFATTDSATAGSDANRVELIINGTLTVNGSSAMPVTFTSPGS